MALINGIFYHIAKTSGSSQINIINKYDNLIVNNLYFLEVHNNMLDDNLNSNIFRWTFVRNPLDRLASILGAWKWKKVNKTMMQLLDLAELGSSINWEIPTYPEHIKRLDIYQQTDMGILMHMRPMHLLLDNLHKNNIKLNFIGRFEKLHQHWAYVAMKCRIKDKLLHINKSNHYPYQKYFIKSKILNRAIELYQKDFEYFNYKKGI